MDTFEDAIRASIKAYFKGMEPKKLNEVSGSRPKYTKKFFDKFEEDNTKGSKLKDVVSKGEWS